MTFKERIRQWLGLDMIRLRLDDMPTKSNLAGVELAQRDRHSEILAALAEIKVQLQVQHVGRRPVSQNMQGYEEVQLEVLADMLANPPKEEY